MITDPSVAAFYPMLSDLLDVETLPVLAVAVRRYGLPGSTPGLKSLREKMAQAETDVPDETVDALQAITSPPAGFGEPRVWAQALVNASQRIARIEVNGRASGTGVLVGPDLLLTAAHVLDRSAWPPRETPMVTATFDYIPTPDRSESEIGLRVRVRNFLCGSLPSEAEAFNRAVLEDPSPDCLDFALLSLARDVAAPDPDNNRPGSGYYRLDPDPYSFDDAGLLFIPQHPLGMLQKISYINQAPKLTPSGVRVRYRSNTLPGSSGSPIIDISGKLVAIHHYYAAGKNQGVPTAKIAEAIVRAGFGSLIDHAGGGAAGGDRAAAMAETPVADPSLASQLLQAPMVNRVQLPAESESGLESGDHSLDLTGPRMRRLEEDLREAYPTSTHARTLVDRAGVNPAHINWNSSSSQLIREVLKAAVLSGRTSALIISVLDDPSAISAHTDLRDLVGPRWLRENTAGP